MARTLNPYAYPKQKLLPAQKIPLKEKNEEWRKQCVEYVIRTSSSVSPLSNNPHRVRNIRRNYDLYEGNYDKEEMKYVTNPHNVDDELPERLKEYNIVRPLIDSIVGEEVNRPLKFTIARTTQQAHNEFSEEMLNRLQDTVMQTILAKLGGEQEQQQYLQMLQQGQIQPPEEIARWATEEYKDVVEEYWTHVLYYLIEKLELKTPFTRGFIDLVLNNEEIYFVGEECGLPVVRRVVPTTFSYEYSPDMYYIEDATWVCERMMISYADLHDKFKGDLKDKDLNTILERMSQQGGSGRSSRSNKDPWELDSFHEEYFSVSNEFPWGTYSSDCIEVIKVHWKSFRKIFFITLNNPETNEPVTEIVDEDYVMTGDEEEVVEDWVMEVWQGHYVPYEDIYFGMRPISVVTDFDDPTTVKMPYIGITQQGKSVADLLRPMQITYLSLWYRMELLLARDMGQVIGLDITQMPKSMHFEKVGQWAHMIKSMGIALFNPYENGWNIPGREGRPSGTPPFQVLNLSVGDSLRGYLELVNKIEQMAMQVIGFNPQRLGQVGHRDGAQATQQALQESYNTSAYLSYRHDTVKQRVMRALLNTAMCIFERDQSNSFLNYIGDDGMKVMMRLPENAFETMDLFITNSMEEQQKLQKLENLFQPAMQNGATLVDVISMMQMKSLTQIRLKMEEIERRKQQQMQQQEQQQQQVQQAQMQQVEMDRKVNMEKANADRTLKKYTTDLENQTKLQIAELNAQMEQLKMENPEDKSASEAEIQKLELEVQKIELQRDKQLAEAQFKHLQLQEQSDLQREQLQSQNALKMEEADNRRRAEVQKLEIEREKLKEEKRKIEDEIRLAKLEHNNELEKLKREFENQRKLLIEQGKQAVRQGAEVARKEAQKLEHDRRTKVILEDKKKEQMRLDGSLQEKIEKMKLKGDMKLQRMKLAEAKAKAKSMPKPKKPTTSKK